MKLTKKTVIIGASVTALLCLVLAWTLLSGSGANEDNVSRSDTETETVEPEPIEEEKPADKKPDKTVKEPEPVKAPPQAQDYSSITLLVNKQNALPSTYVPDGLRLVSIGRLAGKPDSELMMRGVAATAAESMAAAASDDGVNLDIGSGYRSYATQATLYNSYVATYGQAAADTFSARPGTSEHQTGLALDVVGGNGACWVEVCFENTAAGKWVRKNAHKFGFVIRYPSGKQAITGYQYEPWHLRYLGVDLATELKQGNLTLEEYYGS